MSALGAWQSSYGHTGCVRLLLEGQADLTCTDGDGDTAATNARKAGRLDVVELLHQEERRRIDIERQKRGESEVGATAHLVATARASWSHGTEADAATEAVEAPPDGHPSLNACRRAAIAVDNRSAEEAEAWLDEHIDDADIDAPIRGDATRAIVEHLRKLRYEDEKPPVKPPLLVMHFNKETSGQLRREGSSPR